MIKLMLVDDHSMVREGLKQLLELDKNLHVVAEAADGIETLEKLKVVKPDILLLDISMPGMNGIETLENVKKIEPNIKVLMLTSHEEIEYLMKAIEKGCDGYVLKTSDSALLKKAIHTVYEGEKFIQPSMMKDLSTDKASADDMLNELTKREIEVLKLIAEGLFNKEIAAKLVISERTVKNHVSNIFKKIDVSDRTQAAVFAIKNNLVSL